ncbi:hypothetical protein MMC28_011760 [Mycoblastus sanguinarius]|nr:hypothetical protein [Mycoblastus sanguinarius]
MPPPRTRYTIDDSRSEASSTKERQPGHVPLKARRNGILTILPGSNLKDVTNAPQSTNGQQGLQDAVAKINWSTFDLSVLHAYRHAHHLDTPPAFTSSHNQSILTQPGIGQRSPIMARHKHRQRISKDHLALAVRKDFNAAMTVELELISSFLYTVHNQEKNFRMRFEPSQAK